MCETTTPAAFSRSPGALADMSYMTNVVRYLEDHHYPPFSLSYLGGRARVTWL